MKNITDFILESSEISIKGSKDNFRRYMKSILDSFCRKMNYSDLEDEDKVMDDLKKYLMKQFGADENLVNIIIKDYGERIKNWLYKNDIIK